MKQGKQWVIAAYLLICFVTLTSLSQANEPNEPLFKGDVQFRYGWIGVDGDDGRFREDNWITDEHTGGLDRLHMESTRPDAHGYEWLLEGRSLYDYEYDFSLLGKKRDSHYFKVDFDSKRRYFDGSNEFFDERLYGLPSGSEGFGTIAGTNEQPDGSFFVDRRNYNIEFGLTPPEGTQWTFGWHRLEKDGRELLLRGDETIPTAAGIPRFRGIPALAHMKGITDTIYVEAARTFDEKYNFRLRQEFEQYHDKQLIEFPRFLATGAVNQYRTFQDDPGYTNWRTMLMFDSFLDEKTYVTANYMYDYLNNDSTRDEIRLKVAQPDFFIGDRVGNSRRTNVGAGGYRKADFLDVPKLDFTAGLRVEDSRTAARGQGFGVNPFPTLRIAMTDKDEVRIGETIRLVYTGMKKTTLSLDANLEQRYIDWSEFEDVRSHEIITTPGDHLVGPAGVGGFLDRTTDTDMIDQIYTAKAVHRFNAAVKSTLKLRYKNLLRKSTDLFDNDELFYPGLIDHWRRTGSDMTASTDLRINKTTSATLSYQFIQESITTDLGDKNQNLEIHRGSGSLSFIPMQNLFLVPSFMLENFALDTPVNGDPGTELATGSRPFDFRGNYYSLMLDGTYAFNEKVSATFGVRHTEALGTVDFAGDYVFDKVELGLKHRIAANQTVGYGYQFYNFNNHDGGSFDDYKAHGAYVTYAYTF